MDRRATKMTTVAAATIAREGQHTDTFFHGAKITGHLPRRARVQRSRRATRTRRPIDGLTPVVLLIAALTASHNWKFRLIFPGTARSTTSLPEWIIVAAYTSSRDKSPSLGSNATPGGPSMGHRSRTHPYCRTPTLTRRDRACAVTSGGSRDTAARAWKCVQNTPLFGRSAPAGSDAYLRRRRRIDVCARNDLQCVLGFGNTPIKLNQVAIETLFENDTAPKSFPPTWCCTEATC